jgi:hypothetical protein
MTLTSIVEQRETMNPGAEPYGYPWRFNLLDMIGIGQDLSPVSPRSDKSGPPEEDRYDNPMFDWELVGPCRRQRDGLVRLQTVSRPEDPALEAEVSVDKTQKPNGWEAAIRRLPSMVDVSDRQKFPKR